MTERRITRNRVVLIIGGTYKGRTGLTEERYPKGWLIKFKDFYDYVLLEHIKLPA